MRVGILGLGLMGGSLALALRARRPNWELSGDDADPTAVSRALERGLISPGSPREADLVVLAAPIPALPELLMSLSGHPGVVTDLASTKGMVMSWAQAAGVDLVGGHPMCGRERSGLAAADEALYEGAPWILTRDEPVVTELVKAVGSHPIFMGAELHDQLVAGVSHAAFLLSTAYVLALAGSPRWKEMQQVAGSGFREMSRLAAGDPQLYSAIVSTNREAITEAIRSAESSLARLRQHLEAGDPRLVELFEEAKQARDRWVDGAREG